jgi:hypothetical protein
MEMARLVGPYLNNLKERGDQMKSLLGKLGVILMAVVIFYSYNSFAEIQIKYDKFKDVTVVRTDPKRTGIGTKLQPALSLVGFYSGQTPSIPNACELGFVLTNPSWAYLRCHSLYCLADGKPIELPPSKHRGDVVRSSVLEQVFVLVSFSIIEQLSKSEKVEFKLCNTEFTLKKNEMQDLKTFVETFLEKK